MRIHLSNATTQHKIFFFRDPLNNGLRTVEIGSGRQTTIAHPGWGQAQVDKILEQIHAAGGHDAAEAHRRIKRFDGFLYRVEAVIGSEEIAMGHESVKQMQNDRSVDKAVTAVLKADAEANPVKGRRATRRTEVEVKQLVMPGEKPTGNETAFSVIVDPKEGENRLQRRAVA